MKLWLPDVSEHQGKIDWNKLDGKIPGAIIRTGYGDNDKGQDDIYAAYNLKECKRLGISYATYLYSYANTVAHIKSEIAHEKRMTKGYEPLAHILDIEEWSNRNFVKEACELWLEAFSDGIVYAGQAYWRGPLAGLECQKWIPAYGSNDGTRQDGYKPKYDMVGWQFTSRYRLSGISGNVDMSEWYGFPFADMKPIELKQTRRVVTKKEVAALIMKDLCIHNAHGYTMDMDKRWGTGEEEIDIYGRKYKIKGGDRDCSTAVINAYEAAGISCGGATYTGNMRKCMTGTGNFVWRSMKFIAQMGDSYLYHNDRNGNGHTAMCLSAEPDVLMEFSINEKGTALGGKVGDQLQKGETDAAYGRGESHLALYYDYPWNGILQCVNEEIAFIIEEDGTFSDAGGNDDGYTVVDNKKSGAYEISGTGTPSKAVILTGLLKYGKRVTPRLQPKVTAKPCSFSLIEGLTRINVCDYITTDKKWAYCKVNEKYGYILNSSILDYLRIGGQTIEQAARWAMAGDFGEGQTMTNALLSLGYNPAAVQSKIRELS